MIVDVRAMLTSPFADSSPQRFQAEFLFQELLSAASAHTRLDPGRLTPTASSDRRKAHK